MGKISEVVYEEITKGVDLIITHHPFIFSKINRVNSGDALAALQLSVGIKQINDFYNK